MAMLIGMSEEVKGTNIEIEEENISIGRKPDNTIPIDNPTVSGHHCEVYREEGAYYIKDLGSTNGTRINNQDIEQSKLRGKDILQVGSIEFMFDASPGEVLPDERAQTANVEVAPGPATAPQSFGNISPFGARRAESKGLWFVIIVVLGLVALGALAMLLVKLLGQS